MGGRYNQTNVTIHLGVQDSISEKEKQIDRDKQKAMSGGVYIYLHERKC